MSLEIFDKRRSNRYQHASLHYAMNCGFYVDSDLLFEESDILDLVNVKFKFEHVEGDDCIKAYISSMLQKSVKGNAIEINVEYNEIGDSVQCICKDGWSEWKFIVDQFYTSRCEGVLVYICDIKINVNKVEQIFYPQIYKDTDFTDFHLRAEDGSVAVHKIVLAGHSDVFKTMLKGKWKETVEGCLELKGVTQQTLLHLKDYMYLNTLPEDGLQQLLLLAMCYMIDDLKIKCIVKLSNTVTSDNYFALLKFALDNDILDLTFAIITYTSENIVENGYKKMKNLQVPKLEEM